MQYIDTMSLRSKASRFGAASVELKNSVDRLAETDTSLTEGGDAWKGQGALGFLIRSQKHREDITLASKAFYQAAQALISLAGQFDQVNQLRREAEQMRFQIEDLHSELRYTDDPARQSSIRDSIHSLSARKRNTENYADQLESRADQNASTQFNEIADMCDRLRTPDSYAMDWYWWAPVAGLAKNLGNVGGLGDSIKGRQLTKAGFSVQKIKTKKGYYIQVNNGHLAGIKGRRYFSSNARHTPQVFKYFDPKSGAITSIRDLRSFGTRLGYAGVIWETSEHFVDNIKDEKGWNYTTAELFVDVGFGVGGMAVSAAAGAKVGAMIGFWGGPVGAGVGAVTGLLVGIGLAYLTDGWTIHGKAINEHAKEGLSNVLDGVGNLAVSGYSAVSSIFDDSEE